MTLTQAQGWPALAAPNMHGPMVGGNSFSGSSSSPLPGTGMVPPTLPANGGLPGEAPRYEGQLVSHIMQVLYSFISCARAYQSSHAWTVMFITISCMHSIRHEERELQGVVTHLRSGSTLHGSHGNDF